MKKAYYIVTIILSGILTALSLFLAINFIIFIEFDSTTFGTFLIGLIGLGFLIASIYGLVKRTFVLSIVLAKLGILVFGVGALIFSLMAFEHDLGIKTLSFTFISWIIAAAFIVGGVLLSVKHKNKDKDKRKSRNIDKLLSDPMYSVIPKELCEYICRAIVDYNTLDDDEMMEKYGLNEIWFSVYEYIEEKKKGILGFIILNLLVDKDYVIQVDYKEDPKDYLDNIKEYWDCETKIVEFEADNDQIYLAKVPADSTLENIYEIKIKTYTI